MPTTLPDPRKLPAALPAVPFDGIHLILTSYAQGAALGLMFAAAILAFDVGSLWTLIAGDGSYLAAALLGAGMALTFASIYTAAAIMLEFRNQADGAGDETDTDVY